MKDETIDIAVRAKESREFLAWHTDNLQEEWLKWMELSAEIMQQIRQTRMAIGHESRQLISECGDVRKFFLADDHEKEMVRLREFIELAERLRSLKSDGTLDRLADTILKIS